MTAPISLPIGSVAMVSGAASGIGRATAIMLASAGARLAIVDIDASGLEATEAQIAENGGAVKAYVASVTDVAAISFAVADAEKRFGPCSILVNNAGILLRGQFDGPDALEQWTRTIDVNVNGAFHVSRAVLPALKATRGCIVNTASIHAVSAVGNSAAYTASKGALKQFTQALAVELAPHGVRVNAVAPGAIRTAMTGSSGSLKAPDGFLSRVPMGRIGEANEVASAILFLVSDLASYITGVTLPVDGGYLAG